MSDSQIPDYKKPWCPECQEHTEYEAETYIGDHGEVTENRCLCCDSESFVPIILKDKLKFMSLLITGGFMLMFVLMAITGNRNSVSFWVVISISFLSYPAILWATCWADLDVYRKWEKWAKERGWKEGS